MKTKQDISWKLMFFMAALLLLIYLLQINNDSPNQDSPLTTNNYTSSINDSDESQLSAPENIDMPNDTAIEGSKYDQACKESISKRYDVKISEIHYTETQSEDSKIGDYLTSKLNYGKVYRGEPLWLCTIFVSKDGKTSVIVYDL